MLQRFRNQVGTAGLIVAIVALVAALGGGAYAATGGSGGGKATASAKAKQGKQGKPGKTGPAGPAGPAGPTGPAGAAGPAGPAGINGEDGEKGKNGTNGTNGTNGKSVAVAAEATGTGNCSGRGGSSFEAEGSGTKQYACNGAPGAAGATGSPWTAGGTLPANSTETGGWALNGAVQKTNLVAFHVGYSQTSISFDIPLTAALPAAKVQANPIGFPTGGTATQIENCPGSMAEPKAKSGFLCVYTGQEEHAFLPTPEIQLLDRGGEGASKSGAIVRLTADESSEPVYVTGSGSWAVTG